MCSKADQQKYLLDNKRNFFDIYYRIEDIYLKNEKHLKQGIPRAYLILHQCGRCFVCDKPMLLSNANQQEVIAISRDHFIPICFIEKYKKKINLELIRKVNYVYAHKFCNSKKSFFLPSDAEVDRFCGLLFKCVCFRKQLIEIAKEMGKKKAKKK